MPDIVELTELTEEIRQLETNINKLITEQIGKESISPAVYLRTCQLYHLLSLKNLRRVRLGRN